MVTFNLDRLHILDICSIGQEIKDIYVYGSLFTSCFCDVIVPSKKDVVFLISVNCKVMYTVTNVSTKIEITSSRKKCVALLACYSRRTTVILECCFLISFVCTVLVYRRFSFKEEKAVHVFQLFE